MVQIVISVGVHANEINASRSRNEKEQTYAEELAEKLRAQGHEVIIEPRPVSRSSTKEVLEFNHLKTILQTIINWMAIRKVIAPHPDQIGFQRRFFDFLSDNERKFLDDLLERPDVQTSFKWSRMRNYRVWNQRTVFVLADRLKPFFNQHPDILQKARKAGVFFGGGIEDNLATQFVSRRGDVAYRKKLSQRFPNASIIDLHNWVGTAYRHRLGVDWKRIGLIAARKENSRKEFGGGRHDVNGKVKWITVELPATQEIVKIDPQHSYSGRFFDEGSTKENATLRKGTSDYERQYGTQYFPASAKRKTTPIQVNLLANWIHHQITSRKPRPNQPRRR